MPTYPPPPAPMTSPVPLPKRQGRIRKPGQSLQPHARRAWWLKQLLQWHWISSAICLVGMVLFAATGITLNHAGSIESTPQRSSETRTLPTELLTHLEQIGENNAPLPRDIRRWLSKELGRHVPAITAEWSDDEVYLALPRPGGDAWLAIDRSSGGLEYEQTDRGAVAWLNDLHKGRNTGVAWSWFIDVFSVACLVFSLTGLFILWMHARNRPMVWPMVGLGAVIPLLLIILFIH